MYSISLCNNSHSLKFMPLLHYELKTAIKCMRNSHAHAHEVLKFETNKESQRNRYSRRLAPIYNGQPIRKFHSAKY